MESLLPQRLRTPSQRIDLATPVLLDAVRALAADAEVGPAPLREGELLLIGRRHQRDNNSWMHNVPRLTRGRPRHQLQMHPDDLAARGIADGDAVRVTSASGSVVVEVQASADLMPGVVSLPHGYGQGREGVRQRHAVSVPGVSVNDLTDPARTERVAGNGILNGVPVTITAAR